MSVFEAKLTSPAIDLVPHPDIARGLIDSFSPQELRMAQQAYNLLHAPSNALLRHEDLNLPHVQEPITRQLIEFYGDGVDALYLGFRGLRRFAGEIRFGGLQPDTGGINEQGRTRLLTFLAFAGVGKLGFSRDGHDLYNHVLGGLLMIPEVRAVVMTGGQRGVGKIRQQQIDLGNDIDSTTAHIHEMWRYPHLIDDHVRGVARGINNLRKDADITELSASDAVALAHAQSDAIADWRAKTLFVEA